MAIAALSEQRWEVVGGDLGTSVHERALADARCVRLIPGDAPVLKGFHDRRSGASLWEAMSRASDPRRTDHLVIADESFLEDEERILGLVGVLMETGRWFELDLAADIDTLEDLGAETLVRLGVTLVSIEVEPDMEDLPERIRNLRNHGIHVVATRIVDPDLCDELCIQRQIEFLSSLDADRIRLDFVGGIIPRWAASAVEEDVNRNCSTGYRAARTSFMGYQTVRAMPRDPCIAARLHQMERRVRDWTYTLSTLAFSPAHEMERWKAQNLSGRIDEELPPDVGQRLSRFVRATSALLRS